MVSGPSSPASPISCTFAVQAVAAHADVRGDARVRLTRELPVVARDLEVGELGTGRRERERDHLVLRREVLGGGPHEPARLAFLPLAPPREPIGEHRTQAGVVERLDHGVGVRRRALDVRPVEQRRDPGVDRAERRDEVADVGVLGSERRRELVQHVRDVARPTLERDVGADVAQQAFPDVTVGVDEPGHHDHAGGVDHLGVAAVRSRPTSTIAVPVDQHVAARQIPDRRDPC